MKKLLSTGNNSNTVDGALLVARVGIAILMLVHGLPKMSMLFSGEPIQFLPFMGMSAGMSLALAVFAEVVCSLFILVGFATRLAVIPLIITMLVALLVVHSADPFSAKELAVHYLLTYVVLFFAGSGRYSVDRYLSGKKEGFTKNATEPALATYR